MSTVAIIGAGMMGSAMCRPLSDNGHRIRLAGTPLDRGIIDSIKADGKHPKLARTMPDNVELFHSENISQALDGADLVIGGVSSLGVDWFIECVLPLLKPGIPVLSVTKGLRDMPDGTLEIIPDFLGKKLPEKLAGKISFNAIGGPCISHELAARRHTEVVFYGSSAFILKNLREMLQTKYYHISISNDLAGVEVCAAMKNAYAMGISFAAGMMEISAPDKMAMMYNPQAALFGQSCREICRIVKLLGGRTDNVNWLPGSGDLYVTIFGGRTRRLGVLLGKGRSFEEARLELPGETLESVAVITCVSRALSIRADKGLLSMADYPLLVHMNDIINNYAHVNIPWKSFIRDSLNE